MFPADMFMVHYDNNSPCPGHIFNVLLKCAEGPHLRRK